MSEFETREWRRYGKDRTYVVDAGTGAQLGYRDNVRGDLVPTDPATAPRLERWAALADPPRETLGGAPGEPETAQADPAQPAPVPAAQATTGPILIARPSGGVPVLPTAVRAGDRRDDDEDLSVRRPGHAARVRAEEELAARRAAVGRFWTWLGRVVDLRTDERAWRIGAAAEETIGAELERLVRHGWRVLHAVPVGAGDSDIDHVLIGPAGVFTVNSKHHPNARVWVVPRQVRVNNQPVPYLRNSRHEAARAGRLLTAAVGAPVAPTPVLVFRLGNGSLTIRERPDDVVVLRASKAWRPLRRKPAVLTPEQVEAIYEAARWRSTWQPR